MTFKTLLLAAASTALLGACASPYEYNTYDVNKAPSSYSTEKTTESSNWTWSSLQFWESEDDYEDMEMDAETESTPLDITAPAGRI